MTGEEAEKSRWHLHRFCEYWKKRKMRLELKGNGIIMFRAKVQYEIYQNIRSQRKRSEITGVIIQLNAQPGAGKVSLEEAGFLVAEFLHLDFSPDFQRYRFGKLTHSLWIRGEKSKMGAPYRVKIKPVRRTADG